MGLRVVEDADPYSLLQRQYAVADADPYMRNLVQYKNLLDINLLLSYTFSEVAMMNFLLSKSNILILIIQIILGFSPITLKAASK